MQTHEDGISRVTASLAGAEIPCCGTRDPGGARTVIGVAEGLSPQRIVCKEVSTTASML
jgi:hypothetical protein